MITFLVVANNFWEHLKKGFYFDSKYFKNQLNETSTKNNIQCNTFCALFKRFKYKCTIGLSTRKIKICNNSNNLLLV